MNKKSVPKSAPVYTQALLYTAVQTAFFSFLVSFYSLDVLPVGHWLMDRLAIPITAEKHDPDTNRLIVMSPMQLARYDGSRNSVGQVGLYLAVLGKIYDVGKGGKYYGSGGDYHFFAGKDATRAFETGDFTKTGLIDDVRGLSSQEMLGIEEWQHFYLRDYRHVGFVYGTYYDSKGNPTARLEEANEAIRNAHIWREGQRKEMEIFPPCNSEWHKDQGRRFWCSNKSGGIQRDWRGVPRQLFKTDTQDLHCVCVKNFGLPSLSIGDNNNNDPKSLNRGDLDNPNLKEYPGCSSTSSSCRLTT